MKDFSVADVVSVFGIPEMPSTEPVSRDQIFEWMKSEDIEVLGAVYSYILDRKYSQRIQPPLRLADYQSFVLRYYERCFQEDPDGEWADTRYGAGRDLVGWFLGLWNDSEVPRTAVVEIRDWLARVYVNSDEAVRRCIINSTLEHLFEVPQIAKFFNNWKSEPLLADAYKDALAWQKKGLSDSN
jgi:hypothetical protein